MEDILKYIECYYKGSITDYEMINQIISKIHKKNVALFFKETVISDEIVGKICREIAHQPEIFPKGQMKVFSIVALVGNPKSSKIKYKQNKDFTLNFKRGIKAIRDYLKGI